MTATADAARLIEDVIDDTSDHNGSQGYEACNCRVTTKATAPAVIAALIEAGWTPPRRRLTPGTLATIDAARAWDECGAFAGFDATGRTIRIVRPQYDPGVDGDPGYWVVLADPAAGEPSTEQWVAGDLITLIPATEEP